MKKPEFQITPEAEKQWAEKLKKIVYSKPLPPIHQSRPFSMEEVDYLTRELGINIMALANIQNTFTPSEPLTVIDLMKLAYDAGVEHGRIGLRQEMRNLLNIRHDS